MHQLHGVGPGPRTRYEIAIEDAIKVAGGSGAVFFFFLIQISIASRLKFPRTCVQTRLFT